MIIITGGAGFIGSATLWALNQRGDDDILIVDNVTSFAQRRNLEPLKYKAIIDGTTFRRMLHRGELDNEPISAVVHLAAISSIARQDNPQLRDINVTWTQEIIRWCAQHDVRCMYASSSAVYGMSKNFSDDHARFDALKPVTPYGASKLAVDVWARNKGYLDHVVGLRYFNLFGPNELHKGTAGSLLVRLWRELNERRESGRACVSLYKSYNPEYPDGGAKRDFIYIKDVADINLFFLEHANIGGVFNVGTGQARSFQDLADALFAALKLSPCIDYIEMPIHVRAQYPDATEADISKLRQLGYASSFSSLEAAVRDCIQEYFIPDKHLGQA